MTDIRRDLVALLPRLRRFALSLSGNASDADELVREAANRAIQKSHHWKGEGRIESWLFSLTRATWAEELKRRRREQEATVLSNEGRSANLVLSLPGGLASALLLVDVEEFSYPEAAAILGIHVDLLCAHLCAARLDLAGASAETSERRA